MATCNEWMPRAKVCCARPEGHKGKHSTPEREARHRARSREWSKANPDKALAQASKWTKANPDKVKAAKARHYASQRLRS